MSRISNLRQVHNEELEKHCKLNKVSLTSVQKLLEAEKTKKLLKRNALIQQSIDKEIDNSIENENR
ncbi:MAG: hypothetical protein B6D44_00015 [Ignavibacteriales bacterium UTCHB2]|nr:MAG: hypothetical protein B6D44_00015 [Ignavibacteriales bacterium UTCHB2]